MPLCPPPSGCSREAWCRTEAGDGNWAPARDLATGAWLRTSSGTWVQATVITAYTTKTHTYNLTVADHHTYYVTAGNTDTLVSV